MKKYNRIIKILVLIFILILNSCKQNNPDINRGYEYDVVIVGGGMSGLITGFMLRDLNVLILAKEDSIGGNIKYREWNGFKYSSLMEFLVAT
jgi:ribulose 1,5-bisphosphate synthetase/thiazole synthase